MKDHRWFNFLLSTTFIATLMPVLMAGCSSTPISAPVTQRDIQLSAKSTVYRVKRGDTLFSIAWQTRKDLVQLAKWNGLTKPYRIYPGQKLKLYAVKSRPKRKITPPVKQSTSSQKRKYIEKKQYVEKSLKKVLKVRWQWPLKGAIEEKFSNKVEGRDGIDISARHQVTVRAAADGKVVYSGSGLAGYGNLLIIKHNDEYLSAYGFNRRLLAKEGDFVRAGVKVAEAGWKGGKRLLHFEIRRHGKPVDPLKYLPRK